MTLSIRFSLPLAVLLTIPVMARGADTGDDLFDLEDLRVKITEGLSHLDVLHEGEKVLVMRHQDPAHTVDAPYAKTGRDCPPFCIQPMRLTSGVETIGELELLDFLARMAEGDESVLVVDSRTAEWVANGIIPGAVNIPYTKLDPAHASPREIAELLELDFGVIRLGALWNFSAAKTLIFYCNGAWCGQSPTAARRMIEAGYPPKKIFYYRGGMQVWQSLGLTVVSGQ